jgi:hypothetical protein
VTKFLGRKDFRNTLLNLLIISALQNLFLLIFQLADYQAVTNKVFVVGLINCKSGYYVSMGEARENSY